MHGDVFNRLDFSLKLAFDDLRDFVCLFNGEFGVNVSVKRNVVFATRVDSGDFMHLFHAINRRQLLN